MFNEKYSNGKNKLSFNLIRNLAIEILKYRADIVDLFSFTYPYVFIDEFQDTCSDQYELIKILFKDRGTKLLAVGDINQSIMLWAGAKKQYLKSMKENLKPQENYWCKILGLVMKFRKY